MPATPGTHVEIERRVHGPSLRASIRDGTSHAVMLGAGETYIGPFGIFLGASTLQVGLLAALPQLVGALLQWFGALASERFRSRRQVIVAGVLLQALLWIPLALWPFLVGTGSRAVLLLIGLAVLIQGTQGFVAPIWNSLIGDLIPERIRGRFFGRRNRLGGMATFLALLTAGGILELFRRLGEPALGFLMIFGVALLARLNSVRWLLRYEDPPYSVSRDQRFTFWQFLSRAPYSNFAKFVFFLATINFAVAFSAPYFALYMLRDLHLSYLSFTTVTAVAAVAQFLTFRYWGGLSDRFGNKKIMNMCGIGISLVPVLWLPSGHVVFLSLIQVFAGFVWAGFSLAAANFLFDAVTPAKRARCAAYQGIVNGVFVLCGSMLGGFVATRLPGTLSVGGWSWTPRSGLLVIFLVSGLMRLVAASLLLPRFKEVRPVEPIRHRELAFRISHIRPIAGATFSVLTGLFGAKPEADRRADPRRED